MRLASFRYGFFLPLRAARLILREPTLLLWSLLPLLITAGLYFWVLGNLQSGARNAVLDLVQSWGWDPQGFWTSSLLLLTQVTLFLVGAVTFSITASVVASPFNDTLAEKTESRAEPPLPPTPAMKWRAKLRLVWLDVAKSLLATGATLAALALSWIPILNILAFALAFLLLCFQYTSYPQTRRGIGIRGGVAFLWRHLYACLGFGAAISLLYAIPLVSIFVLPLAVVGGTLLVARAPGAVRLPSLR